jgi:hypothetical protein
LSILRFYALRAKKYSTADLNGSDIYPFNAWGAYGHLSSPSSLGKSAHQQKGIASRDCALSQGTWRRKVQRAALTHALSDKEIFIRANLFRSAVERLLKLPT